MAISATYPITSEMNEIINGYRNANGIVGMIGGLTGIHADAPVVAASWGAMVLQLAVAANIDLDKEGASKLAVAAALGITNFAFGTKAVNTVATWLLAIPSAGLSLLLGTAANVGLNWKLTEAFGKAVARYFLQVGRIDSIEVAAQIIYALVATQFGVKHNNPNVVP